MSAIAVTPVYNTFLDVDGNPVDDGYVWIGQPNLDPIANPQNAYWDEALTQLVTQPVRTRQGYPLNGSSVGKLYTAGSYSILVRNENGSDVIGAATFSADDVIDNLDLTGDLTFTGTAQRITGDMSNATFGNRLAFQSSTTNGNTSVFALPNGTGVNSSFQTFNNSDPTNAAVGVFGIVGSTDVRIQSSITGTGTYLPMTFYTGGSERVRIDTSGNVGIGVTPGAPEKFTVGGTAPSSGAVSIANAIYATSPSATTSAMYGYRSAFATAAASFTLNNAYHFVAENATKGSGSTIASQYGFLAADLTSGTNNFGFVGNLSAGVGKWNFYANGSAENFFGGPVQINANLNISAAGARIIGDFSNATLASRVYFQSSTANGNTGIGALPNGTATTATFTVFNTSDPANSSVGQLAATSTDIRAVSTVTGTGSAVPFKVFVGGGEQVRIGGDSTLRSLGSFAVNTPPLINAATYTTLGTDFSLRFSTTNCTITLPAAATYPGRILIITNVTANSVTSDASNVKPLGSDVAGTTILSASAGKFAFLQSDGSFWITLMAN